MRRATDATRWMGRSLRAIVLLRFRIYVNTPNKWQPMEGVDHETPSLDRSHALAFAMGQAALILRIAANTLAP